MLLGRTSYCSEWATEVTRLALRDSLCIPTQKTNRIWFPPPSHKTQQFPHWPPRGFHLPERDLKVEVFPALAWPTKHSFTECSGCVPWRQHPTLGRDFYQIPASKMVIRCMLLHRYSVFFPWSEILAGKNHEKGKKLRNWRHSLSKIALQLPKLGTFANSYLKIQPTTLTYFHCLWILVKLTKEHCSWYDSSDAVMLMITIILWPWLTLASCFFTPSSALSA